MRDSSFETALAYTLRALGARALTTHEIETKLRQRKVDAEIRKAVLERLSSWGYLDDAACARQTVSAAIRSGRGTLRIRMDLKKRGLDPDLCDGLVTASGEDPRDRLQALAEKRWELLSRKEPDFWKRRSKLYRYLSSRGFGGEEIRSVMEGLESLQEARNA